MSTFILLCGGPYDNRVMEAPHDDRYRHRTTRELHATDGTLVQHRDDVYLRSERVIEWEGRDVREYDWSREESSGFRSYPPS